MRLSSVLAPRGAILLSIVLLVAGVPASAHAAGLLPGSYVGTLTIRSLSACEEFAFEQLNSPPGDTTTAAELRVSAVATSLIIEGSAGNTKAGDYFETSAGTLIVAGDHLVGGVRHTSLYYFEMTLVPASRGKGYTGSGTWIFQDACESQAPSYQATLDLAPAGAEPGTADAGGGTPPTVSGVTNAPAAAEEAAAGKDIVDLDESGAKPEKGW